MKLLRSICNRLHDSTIRQKLMVIILSTTGGALVIALLSLAIIEAISFRATERDNLKIVADLVAKNSAAAVLFRDYKAATEILGGLATNPHILSAAIIEEDGIFAVYGKSNTTEKEELLGKLETSGKLDPLKLRELQEHADDFWEWDLDFDMMRPIVVDGQKIGTIVIVSDIRELVGKLASLIAAFAVIVVFVLGVAYFVSSRLQRLISSPIEIMAAAVSKVSGNRDYSVRVDMEAKDELGALAAGFNEMLSQIQSRDRELALANSHLEMELAERRLVEAKLNDSYQFTKAVLDSINDPISILDAHSLEIISANQKFLEMVGAPLEELKGRKCYEAIHGLSNICSGADNVCPLIEMMKTGRFSSAEHVRVKNGVTKISEVSASPIRDAEGNIIQVVHVGHDITERKRAEELIRQSEENLRNILDSVRAGIVVADPEQHRIVYANPYVADLLGTTVDNLVGSACHDFICEGDRGHCPIVEENLTIENYERVMPRVCGGNVNVLESCVLMDYKGSPHFIESFIDIGKLKAAEDALQVANRRLSSSNDELQEINEEMKNFAYIVSHDLRAPLVSIKGFSTELTQSMKQVTPLVEKCLESFTDKEKKVVDMALHEDIPEALDFIGSSVTRMDGLINNVLNLSRLGRKELKLETVDMTAIARGILDSLAHQIEEKRVKVNLGEMPSVTADKVSIEQIMGNLLDNALKYLEPGRDGELEIYGEHRDGEIVFTVKDNGRGIAQEDMHKVFELFRRAGKQDTRGEGMGLAYVKTLIRRHGGRIWCESEFGVGTRFIFTMPA